MKSTIINTITTITNDKDRLNEANNKLIETLLADLGELQTQVQSGAHLDDVTGKFILLQERLNELKTSYTKQDALNQENKRLILNQVDEINNSFFHDNLAPKISEDNIEKIQFVELVNPEPIIEQIGTYTNNIDRELQQVTRMMKKQTQQDTATIITHIENIKTKFSNLNNMTELLQTEIDNIKRINETYEEYINSYNVSDNLLDEKYFFPSECITEDNPELLSYLKISTSTDDLQIENELVLLKNSINHLDRLTDNDSNGNIGVIITDHKTLDSLLGGATDIITPLTNYQLYYDFVLDTSSKLETLQRLFSRFKNTCREFNIKYIRMYNHVLFIVNYLKLTALDHNKDYQIYNYIGLNTIIYYYEIVQNILKAIKEKTTLGRYFNKYHYINIMILNKFLTFVKDNWKPYSQGCEAYNYNTDQTKETVKRATSKLFLYDHELNSNEYLKKSIFIFNAMRDLLDKFKALASPPVAVYLRINHNPAETIPNNRMVFVKDTVKIGHIKSESLQLCNNSTTVTNATNAIDNVKFAEVFDSETFNDNSVLSKYMSIPTSLAEGKSIMLITYGYSGVGKTFTVFGNREHPGMLQSSIRNIQQKQAIYYRVYELYGLAFPYASYWTKPSDEYYQFIYDYTNNAENPDEINSNNISEFINRIKNDPSNPDNKFKILSETDLTNFQSIIDKIDKTREKTGRIKKTRNNVKSSRSIMIFDFKIKIKDTSNHSEDYVNFVIFDLPGKENIKETFVDNEMCIPLKTTYTYKNIRNMAFLSPLGLMLHIDIATKFYNQFKLCLDKDDFTITRTGVDYTKIHNNDEYYKQLNGDGRDKKGLRGVGIEAVTLGLEIMRYFINKNKFIELAEFYENELFNQDNDPLCFSGKNYSLAPFEGYYINENIIGLLTTILLKLELGEVIEQQKELFLTEAKNKSDFLRNAATGQGTAYDGNIQSEVMAQTYFFRFLGKNIYQNMQTPVPEDLNNLSMNFCGQSLDYWINQTYDYNKIFNVKAPPIKKLLDPYFNNITNFYVFYVVSNDDYSKCDKQIKLISDSKVFLDELNKYRKENINNHDENK